MPSDVTLGYLNTSPSTAYDGLGRGTEGVEASVQDDSNTDLYACSHEQRELRIKTTSNGSPQWRRQCLNCGNGGQPIPKSVAAQERPLNEIPPYDEQIEDEWYARQREISRDQAARRAGERTAARLTEMANRYDTEEWHALARRVLERDNFICRAKMEMCTGRARQVHHLTYDHWLHEPLFDLVAVCIPCHQTITYLDREARARVFD